MPSILGLVAATVLHSTSAAPLQISVPPFIEFIDLGVIASAKQMRATAPPLPSPAESGSPVRASGKKSKGAKPVATAVKPTSRPMPLGFSSEGPFIGAETSTVTSPMRVRTKAPLDTWLNHNVVVPYSDTPKLPLMRGEEFGQERLISISAEGLELSQVIKAIAKQSKLNIVLAAKENPPVNISVTDMPLPNALRLLAAVAGMKFVLVGESYIFGTDDVLKSNFPQQFTDQYPSVHEPEKPEIVTNSYSCTYVSASEAVTTLQGAFANEKLTYVLGPGQIIPTAGGASYSSGGGASSSGGSSSSSSAGRPASSSSGAGGNGASSSNSRTLILTGDKPIVERALKLLKQIDIARPQIHIDVRMDDVSNDAVKNLGTTWTFGTETLTERPTNDFKLQVFDRSPLSFTGTIVALETANKAKLLAQPNLTLLDQQTGYVLIGNKINYPVIQQTNSNGNPIFDIKEVNVGVYMQVSGTVSDTGEITLWLYPQVSSISGYLTVNGANYPQISTRETQSTIRVKSGQTVIMAGLIQDQVIRDWQKVPLVGDIPIFGELFKKRRTQHTSSQIIVSITPTIIK